MTPKGKAELDLFRASLLLVGGDIYWEIPPIDERSTIFIDGPEAGVKAACEAFGVEGIRWIPNTNAYVARTSNFPVDLDIFKEWWHETAPKRKARP